PPGILHLGRPERSGNAPNVKNLLTVCDVTGTDVKSESAASVGRGEGPDRYDTLCSPAPRTYPENPDHAMFRLRRDKRRRSRAENAPVRGSGAGVDAESSARLL